MSGFFTFIYFAITIIISIKMGANWLSGSLLLGTVCALFGGSGAKAIWYSGKKFISLVIGVIVTGIGVYAVQDSGVLLNFGDVTITADIWVTVGAIIFFLITSKADAREDLAIAANKETSKDQNASTDSEEQVEDICYGYLKLWGELGLAHMQVYDESILGCKRDTLLAIMKHWLMKQEDQHIKESWGVVFADLAAFQPNIGDTPLGFGVNSLPKTDDVDAIAKAALSCQIPVEIQDKVNSDRTELEAWYAKNVYAVT